jgi:hypothetical protein
VHGNIAVAAQHANQLMFKTESGTVVPLNVDIFGMLHHRAQRRFERTKVTSQ